MDSESYRENKHNNAVASINLDWDILKNLTLTGRLGYDYTNTIFEQFRPLLVVDQYITQGPADLRVRNSTNTLLTLQSFLNYDLTLSDHHFHLLLGYSQEEFINNWVEGYRDDFPNNALYQLNAGALSNQQSSGSGYEWALRSFFGRLNYDYKGKYLFEANARYDGSSRFPKDNRYGLFPSVSAGWRISEEDFFNVSWLDDMKLRASWGNLGNQNIGNYPYQQVLTLGLNAPFGVSEKLYPGAAATVLPNEEITWETTRVVDVGLDLILFRGKLNFSADYFDKLTSGILYNVTASRVLGLTPSVQNAGKVSNKGIDLSILHRNTVGEFFYSLGGNFSYVKNQVEELANVERDVSEGLFVGHPLGSIYGYIAEGLFVDQQEIDNSPVQPRTVQPGDIKMKDISGPDGIPDNIVSADYDRTIIGNQFPNYNFGATLGARYKGFDLTIRLQGIAGVDHRITGYYGNAFQHGTSPQEWMVRERWTQENPNPNAGYPRFQILGGNEPQHWASTYTVMNASYLRVNHIQLGYSLPTELISRIKMSDLRFYFNVRNPVTFDNFREGWDPELLTGYPPVATFILGVNVSF
jgi:TonB-linked SusC/RagA family outer membrane protein